MVLWQLISANMRRYVARCVLSIIAVTLGVAFVAGTTIVGDSMRATFSGLATTANASTAVYVRGAAPAEGSTTTGRSPVPVTLAEQIRTVPGVAQVWPDANGPVTLLAADGTATAQTAAMGLAARPQDTALTLSEGRLPTADDQIALAAATAQSLGRTIGDDITFKIGAEEFTSTVSGIVNLGAAAGTEVVFLNPPLAEKFFIRQGHTAGLVVTAGPNTDSETLRAEITTALPATTEAITGAEKTAEDVAKVSENVTMLNNFLLVFAGISLLVGGFIIVNTFAMVVASRTKELATLRALGGSQSQVLIAVLAEALIIGVVGAILGFGAGIGIAHVVGFALAQNGVTVTGLVITAKVIWWALGVALLVTLTSALWPAVRAARVRPVAAMAAPTTAVVAPLRGRNVLGVAVLFLAACFVPLLAAAQIPDRPVLLGYFAVLAIVAVLLLSAGLVQPLLGRLTAPLTRFGVLAQVARGNVLRDPRRTAVTAGALTTGLAVLSAVLVLSSSASGAVTQSLANGVRADVIVSHPAGMKTATAEALAALPDVAQAGFFDRVPVRIVGTIQPAIVASPTDFDQLLNVTLKTGSLSSLSNGDVVISETTAKHQRWAVGDQITTKLGNDDQTRRIGGIYTKNTLLNDVPLMARSVVHEATGVSTDTGPALVLLTAKPGTDAATVQTAAAKLVRTEGVFTVKTATAFAEAQTAGVRQMVQVVLALLAMSMIIAALGIVNTLLMAVRERTTEIGTLRALGLSVRELYLVIGLESVCTAFFAGLLGAGLGLGVGVVAQWSLVPDGITHLVIPWTAIAVVLLGAITIGVLSALLPAVRAGRLPVLSAIATNQ